MLTRVSPKTKKNDPTKVVIGETRLSYANVREVRSINGDKPKHSVSLLIPKDDAVTIGATNAAIGAVIAEGTEKSGEKTPPRASLKLPLRNGNTERDDNAYAGHYSVDTSGINASQIVDQNVNPILNHSEVHSGYYGRVSINFYALDTNGNRGVAYGLDNIQRTRDSESPGRHASTESEFGAWDTDKDSLV